jgi:hypothetical protein
MPYNRIALFKKTYLTDNQQDSKTQSILFIKII